VQDIRLGGIWESKRLPGNEVEVMQVATKHVFYKNLSDGAIFTQNKILFPAQYKYLRDKK
jgi:hypothetical protein